MPAANPAPSEAQEPSTPDAFGSSVVGTAINRALAKSGDVEQVELPPDEVMINVFKFRALLAKLRVLKPNGNSEALDINDDVQAVLDPDIIEEIEVEENPELAIHREFKETQAELVKLAQIPQVLQAYKDIYNSVYKTIQQAKTACDLYWDRHDLSPTEKMALVRQISRLLETLISWCDEETQNTHNQVAREGGNYSQSAEDVLRKLQNYRNRCTEQLQRIKNTDEEALIQLRQDEITMDRGRLNRRIPKGAEDRLKEMIGARYIVTKSREKLLFGHSKGSPGEELELSNSIMSCLRVRQNVELYGPTGTGKSHLAIHAAKLFSGKDPYPISGSEGVGIHHFLGSASDVGKRNEGGLITCLKEGRVLLIDEDNKIRKGVLDIIKLALSLKPGDVYLHQETGEQIIVPPTFGIIVTRNEKDKKHHKTVNDLSPEYRREFSDGSFEVPYFPPDEIYDHFLIPKLSTDEGRIHASMKDVGGKADDPNSLSPLVAFTQACEEVQDQYCTQDRDGLRGGVFDSGWEMQIFKLWQEARISTGCSLLEFLEFKLLDKVKTPGVRDADRKKIIEILIRKGFFSDKTEADFATLGSPDAVTDQDLEDWRRGTTAIFAESSGREFMDAHTVASLDPWDNRETEYIPPQHENEIQAFKDQYLDFCGRASITPIHFDAYSLGQRKADVLKSIRDYVETCPESEDRNEALDLLSDVDLTDEDNLGFTNEVHEVFGMSLQ